jgi:sugar (pentulose or hexulose) kinase
VAFSIADLCDLLAPPAEAPLVLTGGGARSAFWCRMIAEVTGREVVVPQGAEFGARGAALLAATALGRFPSAAAASAAVSGGGAALRPTGADAAAWRAARERFREARDRALDL